MLEILTVATFLTAIAIFYFIGLRSSVFGISLRKGGYSGFFIAYDFIIFIIPSSLILNILPIESFWVAFKVKQDIVYYTTVLILSSYLLFLMVLYFIYKIFPGSFTQAYNGLIGGPFLRYKRLFWVGSIVAFIIVFINWRVFGVPHAFLGALLQEQNLSSARYTIEGNIISKFTKYFIIIMTPLLAILVADPRFSRNWLIKLLGLISVLFLAGWSGNKTPVLLVLVVAFVCIMTFYSIKINLKLVAICMLMTSILIGVIYLVVNIQYSEYRSVPEFADYFLQRVFVAQMIGIYEEFSLNISDGNYIWHGIPFASFFVEYPIFQKDLMMISESRLDPGNIGIKNTFFVAEVYAMGGWIFILPGIVIYAVNFALSHFFISKILNMTVGGDVNYNKFITSIIFFSFISVTGGFAELFLFKATIMFILLVSPVLAIMVVLKPISRRSSVEFDCAPRKMFKPL